ncbi:hypothetical protein PC129_g1824 [Phytophthora cactorum]|uniref:GPI ethanolamine phosphate transferase 3 n=1 Tax=Phytophthora cactorum TaxID=29920 RepID=A0A8T1IQ94_9STRA|nr:hypothetical protein PC114_g3295 [Phytophthora cactorum]KAG2954219.1 hypothetical protein PC117_g1395 [Phytophthora cactorum]KAG3201440.1 hypothetical protein PC128_g3919 [Phytophthora cactorum]KAG3227595.1 hypothetical protein PC129_g1824 [Phytophthora cactorum]KAG4062416.1 hypothetical protein PC123_g2735 [Phytophthora cactorum]
MGHRVLAALLALHAAALYLFTTGFFLTRFEVSDLSSCQASPSNTNAVPTHLRGGHEDFSSSDDGAPKGCWMPRRFRRVVFVVIDALRFDFAATGSSAQRSTFYSDRLPILNDTLASEPEHALLLKFVADPPTMTMQRLKGLTTGSLPTFLDIKDNMAASSQIVEDNLLRQLRAQQRGVVFMGDDTWDSLYAREFTRKFAFDSFNVKDLHSVDRGVTAHLFPELQKPDWDLLIAHFLGVDHVGHTHGPSSVFMAEKLDEMNGILKKLLQTLKDMPDGDDVLLAVLGDHGMSADGNHGGASDEETGAALFLYSKAALVATGGENDNEEAKELKRYAERILDSSQEVPQVDLVPTLALLSGLPIPFGNLGSVIPSLFFVPPSSSKRGESSALAAFQTLNSALRLNLDQVRRYLFRYSSASKLPERAYDQLERIFMDIKRVENQLEQVQGGEGNSAYSKADLPLLLRLHEDLAKQQQHYLREALSLGRSIWTQFDLCIQYLSFSFVVTCRRSASPTLFGDATPWVLLLASCSYQAFFTTGHANTFTSLQNAAGFVGFDTFNFYTAGALLGLNTFGCFALAVLALPWLNLTQQQPQSTGTSLLLAFSAYFSLNTLVSTLFVALQRRHLMVWAIFAPKFIFDGVVLLFTEFLLLLLLAPFSNHRSHESIKSHRIE